MEKKIIHLPPEILEQLLQYATSFEGFASLSKVANIALVCKTWNSLAWSIPSMDITFNSETTLNRIKNQMAESQRNKVYSVRAWDLTLHSLRQLQECFPHLNKLKVQRIYDEHVPIDMYLIASQSLYVAAFKDLANWNQLSTDMQLSFSRLTSLSVDEALDEENLARLLCGASQLKVLRCCTIANAKFLPIIFESATQLQSLKLRGNHDVISSDFAELSRLSNLTKLTLDGMHYRGKKSNLEQSLKLDEKTVQALTSLKSLSLWNTDLVNAVNTSLIQKYLINLESITLGMGYANTKNIDFNAFQMLPQLQQIRFDTCCDATMALEKQYNRRKRLYASLQSLNANSFLLSVFNTGDGVQLQFQNEREDNEPQRKKRKILLTCCI